MLDSDYSPNELDPLYELVVRSHKGLSESQYREMEMIHLNQEALADHIALLHYDLAACFPGWARIGRYSDLVSADSSKIIVWKSPFVVERASTKLLQDFRISGKEVYMVGFDSTEFENLTVKEAYHLLSGRENFWDDLQSSLTYILKTYKTYAALRDELT